LSNGEQSCGGGGGGGEGECELGRSKHLAALWFKNKCRTKGESGRKGGGGEKKEEIAWCRKNGKVISKDKIHVIHVSIKFEKQRPRATECRWVF